MLNKLLKGFQSLVKPQPRPQSQPQPEPEDWDFSDRRTLVRMKCRFEVIAEIDGHSFPATVADMGVLGLRLRCSAPLSVGNQVRVIRDVSVEGTSSGPVDCEVVWSQVPEGDTVTWAGLIYGPDVEAMKRSWVNQVLHELGFTPDSIYSKRRFVRAECFLTGQFSPDGQDDWIDMRVCNLGVGGTLLEHNDPLKAGEFLKLLIGPYQNLPILSAGGRIVRITREDEGFLYGVEFDDLPPLQVKLLGKYLRALLLHT